MQNSEVVPQPLEKEFERTHDLVMGFIQWLYFCMADTARDNEFTNNHLLSFLNQDILETLMGVLVLVKEGIHAPVIRESRYLLEVSIKLTYIQQSEYRMPIEGKLKEFENTIKSPSISPMKKISLSLLKPDISEEFLIEVGRLYGESLNFVHLTPHSIEYRRARISHERLLGYESEEDLIQLNNFLQRICAASIVFLSHAVPQYVVGDWHVDSSGGLKKWYYLKSKYIAQIDSSLDYKHERQHVLERLVAERISNVAF